MNALRILVEQHMAANALPYFARQVAVILCIFLFGGILTDLLVKDDDSHFRKAVLAFPAGLSAFAATAYAMLICGIPYNKYTVVAAVFAIAAGAVFTGRRSYKERIGRSCILKMLIAAGICLVVACIASSGIIPVSISNDSMYFFRRYPDIIVYYGKLRDQFDFWLTDTGLASVCIDTIPSLFGFSESFGIREFFHINFLAFFALCFYEGAQGILPKKSAAVSAVVVTLLLAVSTPFLILGHWALANMYFMELFFISAYTVLKEKDRAFGISSLFLVCLPLLRIEGTVFAMWLVVCVSLYSGRARDLARFVVAPVILLFGGYCLRIFVGFYVLDNVYLFLTPQKALMLVGMMAAVFIYLMFAEKILKKKMPKALAPLYIAALFAGNLALFLFDTSLYTGNLKAFGDNLFRQSGWGMFPYFVISTVMLIAVGYVIRTVGKNKEEQIRTDEADRFNITLTVGFLLAAIAVSFGRGDVLAENVGDSGNRVLLQIVPLVVMTLGRLTLRLIPSSTEDNG